MVWKLTLTPFMHSGMLRSWHSLTKRCAMCRSRHVSTTAKSASSMNAYAVFCPCACRNHDILQLTFATRLLEIHCRLCGHCRLRSQMLSSAAV